MVYSSIQKKSDTNVNLQAFSQSLLPFTYFPLVIKAELSDSLNLFFLSLTSLNDTLQTNIFTCFVQAKNAINLHKRINVFSVYNHCSGVENTVSLQENKGGKGWNYLLDLIFAY